MPFQEARSHAQPVSKDDNLHLRPRSVPAFFLSLIWATAITPLDFEQIQPFLSALTSISPSYYDPIPASAFSFLLLQGDITFEDAMEAVTKIF